MVSLAPIRVSDKFDKLLREESARTGISKIKLTEFFALSFTNNQKVFELDKKTVVRLNGERKKVDKKPRFFL